MTVPVERPAREILESIEKKILISQQTARKRESEDLKELYKALHAAQKKFKSIQKTGLLPGYGGGKARQYAKISDLVDASIHALHENSLVSNTYSLTYPDGFVSLVTRLYHFPSGQWTESELPLLNGTEEQKRGSSITYSWRYTYAPLMGLVDSSYDDDGDESNSIQKEYWNKKNSDAIPLSIKK